MKCLVIADDFTGANDTGVQLAKKGAKVNVSLAWEGVAKSCAEVLVINTESRAVTQDAAKTRVRTAIEPFKHDPALMIYKKIDSTFRGNVGTEIEEVLRTSGRTLAIIAAAIPAAGRTTVQGFCYVHGVPLLETEFSSDPKTPVVSSRISEIISSQSDLPLFEVSLDILKKGQAGELLNTQRTSPSIAIVDAETDEDLALLAAALHDITQPYILVGAAGFANALPQIMYREAQQNKAVLLVAGSMSQQTREQVEYAMKHDNLYCFDIDVRNFFKPNASDYIASIIEQAIATVGEGVHVVLRTSTSEEDRHMIETLCQEYTLTRTALGECISATVGTIARQILEKIAVAGLFLTGGDMAIAMAQALNAKGYRIKGEVLPCIPYGHFIQCDELAQNDLAELSVITKAGGFGSHTAIKDVLDFLGEEKCRRSKGSQLQ